MVDLELEQLELYRALKKRATPTSTMLAGILVPLAADAREILEYVRATHPSFTRHNIQHSWTIVDRIGRLLPQRAIRALSSTELFLFILAAAFHDVGMVADDTTPAVKARKEHSRRSAEFLEKYFDRKLGALAEARPRLLSNLQFIVESHMLPWDEMAARTQFKGSDLILNDQVRASVLAVLLRIGDLLDADSERSPDVLLECLPGFFRDASSLVHHRRHKNIRRCDITSDVVQLHVQAETKEEHELWSSWFGYLKQDILNANTFVLTRELDAFRLPAPDLQILRAEGATFETWPLEFRIDPSGKIWNVLSTSVYTGEWDFLRELVQNAIDANMAFIYRSDAPLTSESPRGWKLQGYEPCAAVMFSERSRRVVVADNGIGMDKEALTNFLFQVAESGYSETPSHRKFRFPSIATFGIGFVSVLTRANRVIVETLGTAREPEGQGWRVIITGGARDAYVERAERAVRGTVVLLELKDEFRGTGLVEYLTRTFRYPSCPVLVCDLDLAEGLVAAHRAAGTDAPRGLPDAIVRPLTADVGSLLRLAVPVPRKILKQTTRHRITVSKPRQGREAVKVLQARSLGARVTTGAYFVQLNTGLEIVDVRKNVSTVPSSELGIVWIPVALDDLEAGIEWRSWHGLLIGGAEIRAALHVPSDLTKYNSVFTGGDIGDVMDEYDVDEDALGIIERSTSDVGRPQYAYMDSVVPDGDQFRIAREHDLGTDEKLQLDELFDTAGLNLVAPEPGAGREQERESHRLFAAYLDLMRAYHDLSNRVYQDGILVPGVNAMNIAPIGVARARANLTAHSRFVLNVNRNAIDEAPGTLRQWNEAVGSRIQTKVLKSVVEWCKNARILYDQTQFVNSRVRGPLADFSTEALHAMVRKRIPKR